MLFDDLIERVRARNQVRRPMCVDSDTAKFSEMVKGWLVSGVSVAAIFDSKGGFISVHDSENQAVGKASAYRKSGMVDLRIKRVTIR